MNVKRVNSVSFAEKTDEGNNYKKTNSGKISGSVGGAIIAGLGCYSESKKNTLDDLAHESKLNSKTKYVLFYGAVYSAIGFVVGALIDALVNNHRANEADNKVFESQENDLKDVKL